MADDWQPGDLALCLHTRRRREPTWGGLERLRSGAIYTVSRVGAGWGGTLLVFDEVRSDAPYGVFSAHRFRKIRPHTPDAEDAETIALLTGKPAFAMESNQ